MPTKWLLDVDGVLNILADKRRDNPLLTKRYVRSRRTGERYLLCWRPRLIDDVRRATKFVDVLWATTWCDGGDLADLEPVIGLTLTPAFGDRPPHLSHADQKVAAARDVLATGDRLIWTDDDVVPDALRWYPEFGQAVAEGRALLIAPNEDRGITNAQMASIKAFVRAGQTQEEILPAPLAEA